MAAKIFVLSQIYVKTGKKPSLNIDVSTRCWWPSLEEPQNMVNSSPEFWEEYYKDITEGNQIYVVIEEIDKGFVPSCKEIEWYQLQSKLDKVVFSKCSKPECLKQLVHFGMS